MTTPASARTVLDLLDRACAADRGACALDVPGVARLSYGELEVRARRVAACVEPFAARDAVVAIALPRTDPWLYAAILGVMRAGAAYVAIDPAFPARQAAAILADAGAVALIAPPARAAELAAEGGRAPLLTPADLERAAPAENPHAAHPDDLS